MYTLIRKLLFKLDPETAHHFSLGLLNQFYRLGLLRFVSKMKHQPINVMGLTFPNPIGLAAGLDRNGDYVEALSAFGFGFIEIGTITPHPTKGNPRPRLFRLPQCEAIINRMRFANKGLDYTVERLKQIRYKGILGINIAKDVDTPNEKAQADYLHCFNALWPFASYITINISSPNTEGLRALQEPLYLNGLLSALKSKQHDIATQNNKYVPLVIKISPDLNEQEVSTLADILLAHKVDGVIATNTTLDHTLVEPHAYAKEKGGLSGKPLHPKSVKIIKALQARLHHQIPIIACGGVVDESTAKEKFAAGATLLQLYTGFIYNGPDLIRRLVEVSE